MFKTVEMKTFEKITNIEVLEDKIIFNIGYASFEVRYKTNELYTNYARKNSKKEIFEGRIMTSRVVKMCRTDNHGGAYLYCCVAGRGVRFHRLLGYLLYGREIFGKEIDHINGDRGDHSLENIRVCTRDQNAKNASKRGAFLAKNLFSGKLSRNNIKDILKRIESGENNKEISDYYNVDRSNISKIRNGKWRGVEHV